MPWFAWVLVGLVVVVLVVIGAIAFLAHYMSDR
jgi:autotransporter translocation and assembly factor TamB